MKMRLLTLLLMLMFAGSLCSAADVPVMEDVQLDLRSYDVIEVPAGTFIPVISAQEISTQYCPVGYKVRFCLLYTSDAADEL